ncbi:hypothetical protein ACWCPQ_02165 [Nocardia sp. NPDC001965]
MTGRHEAGTRAPRDASSAGPPAGCRTAIVLGVVLTCRLMVSVGSIVADIALPETRSGLGISTPAPAWVFSAHALAYSGLLLLGGRAGDILGFRSTAIARFASADIAPELIARFGRTPVLVAGVVLMGCVGPALGVAVLTTIEHTARTGSAEPGRAAAAQGCSPVPRSPRWVSRPSPC